MIKNLGLEELVKKHTAQYGKGSSKLMTKTIFEFLQMNFPDKNEEYKLIYRKIERFLAQ